MVREGRASLSSSPFSAPLAHVLLPPDPDGAVQCHGLVNADTRYTRARVADSCVCPRAAIRSLIFICPDLDSIFGSRRCK